MDASTRSWLYDPAATRRLVLARRPVGMSVVSVVVSDVVWGDVVRLLRWADAGTRSPGALAPGTWWRLAAACADLLRRLPGLSAEIGERWTGAEPPGDDAAAGRARVARVAARLTTRLRDGRPIPLSELAGEVDALGAAAISALVEHALAEQP
jgi:hypothetical protein